MREPITGDICANCGEYVPFKGNVCINENGDIDAFQCDACRKFSFYWKDDRLISEKEEAVLYKLGLLD
jgi:hypothetical protein